jgi:tape measure domain-containing protein
MTNTVDKRIVEMSFENDRFEKGVDKSLTTIDNLKKSLNFDGAEKGFNGITTAANGVSLNHISNSLDEVRNRFSLLGIVGFTVIQDLTNGAIGFAKKLLEAFIGIDSIRAGFGSYETKINAIKTVMSGTGETIDQVTQSINDLNKYSDRTIFSFQDMTENISKFTNAGLSSKEAATAIQGISNVAAESGANAGEAARAMYNFGQAIQQGSVRLMDWKSIENANMATIEFKTQLLESAAAMGTLQKQADGTFKTLNGGEIVSATKNFNNSLEKQWLTTDVLIKTLGDYASETTEIGKKANQAATQIKTFTQLMDNFADSLKTGWTKTFEIIVGNLNESTTFFTTIAGFLGDTAIAAGKARNAILQGWKDLGGRTKLVEAFQNALNGVVGIVNPLIAAFKEVFPPVTSQQLFNLTEGLAKLTEKFKMAVEGTDKFKRVFRGILAVIDIVKMAIIAFGKAVFGLSGSFSGATESFTELIAKFADWLVGLRDSLKASNTFTLVFGNIAKVLKAVIDGVFGFFAALTGGFKNTEKMTKSKSIANFLEALGEKFKSFGKLGAIISKVFGVLSVLAEKVGPIVGKIASKLGDILSTILDRITAGLKNLDADKVLTLLDKGLFAGVLLSIKSFIDSSKGLIGGGMFAGILLSIKNFIDNGGSMFKGVSGILDSVKGSLDAYQKTLKANTLLKIAGAIGILALSIIALTLVDQTKLVNATAVIGGMFVALATTLDVFEKTTTGGKQLAILTLSLIGISAALLILSGAIVILAKLDPKEAAQGVIAVGTVLGMLLLFQKNSSGVAGLGAMAVGIIALSLSMIVLTGALKRLGGMDVNVLAQGLVGMGAALAIIAVGLNAMSTTVAGSASLLVAAGAIVVLTLAMKGLGEMSLQQIGLALLAIAGAFTVLGLAGALITPIAPGLAIVALSLLAIGAAAAAFGVGVAAIGIGLASVATAIVALSGVTAVGVAAITLVITGLAALIPMLVTQIVKGLVTLFEELAKSGPRLAIAFAGIGLAMLNGFVSISPQVAGAIMKFVGDMLKVLEQNLPRLVETGGNLLFGFLKGISNNIGRVTQVSIDIITAYLAGIALKLPQVIQSGWDLIIKFINGLADATEKNIPLLDKALVHLGASIVKGVMKGIAATSKELLDQMWSLAKEMIESFKSALGIHSPSKVFDVLSEFIPMGAASGIRKKSYLATEAIQDMGQGLVSKFGSVVSTISDGVDVNLNLTPTITPVVDMSNVKKSGTEIDSIFANKALNLSLTASKAATISTSIQQGTLTPQPTVNDQPTPQTNVSFTQNNYSPKELSRLEIYRQTKNQLTQLKSFGG